MAKRAQEMRAQSERFARIVAPVVNALVALGHVGPSELARALNARGQPSRQGSIWRKTTTKHLMNRLTALGLLSLPPRGPYGTHSYSPAPRPSHDTSSTRKALRDRADAWAIDMRPTIMALREAGFVKHEAIAAELNRRAIAPQRAGIWTVSMVKNLLTRLKEMDIRNAG